MRSSDIYAAGIACVFKGALSIALTHKKMPTSHSPLQQHPDWQPRSLEMWKQCFLGAVSPAVTPGISVINNLGPLVRAWLVTCLL